MYLVSTLHVIIILSYSWKLELSRILNPRPHLRVRLYCTPVTAACRVHMQQVPLAWVWTAVWTVRQCLGEQRHQNTEGMYPMRLSACSSSASPVYTAAVIGEVSHCQSLSPPQGKAPAADKDSGSAERLWQLPTAGASPHHREHSEPFFTTVKDSGSRGRLQQLPAASPRQSLILLCLPTKCSVDAAWCSLLCAATHTLHAASSSVHCRHF